MLRKISLAALVCFSPILTTEMATAAHGCRHSRAAATVYRAPAGDDHVSHRHHHGHRGNRADGTAPPFACCGAALSSTYRPAKPDSAYRAAAPYSTDGYRATRSYGSYRSPGGTFSRSYSGAYGGSRVRSPFSGGRLDLSIDGPRYGW